MVRDALAVQFDTSSESIRLERAARKARLVAQDTGRTQPFLAERTQLPATALAATARPMVSAVLVKVVPGADALRVQEIMSGWSDITVHTTEKERELLLQGTVDRARRQIGLFRALLIIISAIVMALILYTLTLDKLHDIAMLKLMGARNSVILGLILQQAFLLGALGYATAFCLGRWIFPLFPRRVLVVNEDLVVLAVIVVMISIFSSLLGIWKAMKVEPNEVVS
jgi:putative ABC transport system permease protein